MGTDHGPPAGAPAAGDSVLVCAVKVLSEPDPERKAAFTVVAYELWLSEEIEEPTAGAAAPPCPPRPARRPLTIVAPGRMRQRGRGGSLASRQAMLHSLVHIECCAIDLAWDAIARFGGDADYAPLPRRFFDDFVRVAADEVRHFTLLLARLRETGSDYGVLPAHDGLWESAEETAGSLPARLAVEHATHEARGLDVLPQTIGRFRAGGDAASADLLQDVIYREEISHCAAGVRWLKFLHERAHAAAAGDEGGSAPEWMREAAKHVRVEEWFHVLVRRHFNGLLKPPFNVEARELAGFMPAWYLPLAAPAPAPAG